MSDHQHERDHEPADGDQEPADDLNLVGRTDEQLPPDPAPEATEEADLTGRGVDQDTSTEVELEGEENGGDP